MELVEKYMKNNPCYVAHEIFAPKGLMLRNVGVSQASAKVLANNWNRPTGSMACTHAFIDAKTGVVYQTLPWDIHIWHIDATNRSKYDDWITVDMCNSAAVKYDKNSSVPCVAEDRKDEAISAADLTYLNAVELFAVLCISFGFDPRKDIFSPREIGDTHRAPDRSDPQDAWTALGLEYTMDTFRSAVESEIYQLHKSIPVAQDISAQPPKPIQIKVDLDRLRIRSGPGNNNSPTGEYTGVGIFEISAIEPGPGSASGWGKLVSGAGWVCLDCVTFLS